MKIHELLTERRLQRVETLYHGTSSMFLRSILKYGLVTNPPKRTFSRDTNFDQSGYDSYDGVYLARDLDFARDAADWATQAHGGDKILITVQAVVGSSLADEDDITRLFISALGNIFKNSSNLSKITELMTDISSAERKDIVEKIVYSILSGKARPKEYRTGSGAEIRFSPNSEHALESIISKSLDILSTAGERMPNTDMMYYIDFYLLPKLRHDPEYETAMQALLKGVRVKNSRTVRVTRNIGFSGKTRILEIKNLDTHEVIYPKFGDNKRVGLASRADYYFFGNPAKNYAWGIGRTPAQAIDDGEKAFEEYRSGPGETTWEDELRQCRVYPTDKFTYDQIDADGYQTFTIKNGLVVVDPN